MFGINATESVHIGQTVMGRRSNPRLRGRRAVLTDRTPAESYKIAALDAVNTMRAIAKVTRTGWFRPLPG